MMDSMLRASALSCLLLLSLAGCEGTLPVPKEEPPVADVIGTSHAVADALIESAGSVLQARKPLLAATFVNIDNLEQAVSFGRIVSEQVSSRFTQRGFGVIELLLRHSVFIKQNGGEFLLSREVQNLSSEHDAQAVIVGTYAVGRKKVYITARLIRAADSIVLASHDYTLPIDNDVAYMLKSR
jgi:TolB-like protein